MEEAIREDATSLVQVLEVGGGAEASTGVKPRRKAAAFPPRSKVTAADLVGLVEPLRRLAYRMRQGIPALRHYHEQDDLVQEVLGQALERLHEFSGRSSLRTWVTSLAQRRLIDLGRRASIRPLPAGDAVEARRAALGPSPEVGRELKAQALELLSWLREDGRDEVPEGFEVLSLLFGGQADYGLVAHRLALWSGKPWTIEGVKSVVRQIKLTEKGRTLCERLGSPIEGEPTRDWLRAARRFEAFQREEERA